MIMIDAGHGGNDPGAVSINGERKEKTDVLNFSIDLARCFEEQGITAYLTRDADDDLKIVDRVAYANSKSGLDFFISIHRNAAPTASKGKASGYECYIRYEEDLKRGTAIMEEISKVTSKPNRGVKISTYYGILKGLPCPGVLLELGFIDNENDNVDFDVHYFDLLNAVCKGICKIIDHQYNENPTTGSWEPDTKPDEPMPEKWYKIQTGAFKNENNRNAYLQKLLDMGIDAFPIDYLG